MNKLREKIIGTPKLKKVMPDVYMTPKPYITDSEIDAILDAVIAALPFASADDEDGYVAAISEVTELLQAAKENKS